MQLKKTEQAKTEKNKYEVSIIEGLKSIDFIQ